VKVELTPEEARIIGALLEKEITTPDQYPLSLNALTSACNQKSNRDPVMNLTERDVQRLLDGLAKRALVVDRSGFGSRVPKYRHLFCNTEFGSRRFAAGEVAVLCELLLRGPQTPGELRTHGARLHPFRDVEEVDAVLAALAQREDGPFVVRLARVPGQREARFAHLFSGKPPAEALDREAVGPAGVAGPAGAGASTAERLARLEAEVERLGAALGDLQRKLGGAP
jgi:uncharacterized protein YceH (UPF0502 family)